MKYIVWMLLAGILMMAVSCNTIKDEDRKTEYTGPISSERYVLLEDYTGVRCINCPNAAAEVKKLQEFYGENLIVVSVYPKEPVGLTMPYGDAMDLRTDEAQVYATEFKIDNFPRGMVNRREVVEYDMWGGIVAEIISSGENYATLGVNANFNAEQTEIQVNVNGTFVEDYKEDGAINVIAMVVEDSIVARQLEGGSVNAGYVHNHVLRTVLGSAWGNRVSNPMPARGTAFSASYTGTVDPVWRPNHLAIVIALVNEKTKEVIQAAYTHVGGEE